MPRRAGRRAARKKRTRSAVAAAGDFDASRYFRDADASVPQRRHDHDARPGPEIVRQPRTLVRAEATAFADELIRDRHLEVKRSASRWWRGIGAISTPRDLPVWKRWLSDNHSANWATTDAICGTLIGPLLLSRTHSSRGRVRQLGAPPQHVGPPCRGGRPRFRSSGEG